MTHQEPPKREPMSGLHLQRTQRDIMGPILVDQTLRQAIMHCWMMLPDDQRTRKM